MKKRAEVRETGGLMERWVEEKEAMFSGLKSPLGHGRLSKDLKQ